MSAPAQRIEVVTQGHEQQRVIVIDEFVSNPEVMVDEAASLDYMPIGPYYPGIRAVVPPARLEAVLPSVLPLIVDVFSLPTTPHVLEAYYSIATTPSARLQPIQRLPHFDGFDHGRIALLHYLFHAEFGGTAFYRHRSTGYESVTEARWPYFSHRVEEDVHKLGLPPPQYISGDTELYEQVASYSACFNRTIIYHGNTLHCGNIPNNSNLSSSPLSGRLTFNCFLLADDAF